MDRKHPVCRFFYETAVIFSVVLFLRWDLIGA